MHRSWTVRSRNAEHAYELMPWIITRPEILIGTYQDCDGRTVASAGLIEGFPRPGIPAE
ncbi:hypothetical protein KRMM14A1004_38740 [Krasilnikovia sp. MM14-A1004]